MEINSQVVKAAMIAKKMNVTALHKASGVSAATINAILHHSRKCNLDTIGKLAATLSIPAAEIVRDK